VKTLDALPSFIHAKKSALNEERQALIQEPALQKDPEINRVVVTNKLRASRNEDPALYDRDAASIWNHQPDVLRDCGHQRITNRRFAANPRPKGTTLLSVSPHATRDLWGKIVDSNLAE
jgi:hypothetical protein